MDNNLTDIPISSTTPVKAGFPNPVEEAGGNALDLNKLIVKHPVTTFYLRVQGDAMAGAGVVSGDIVVVDKALHPRNGDVVVATIEGEFALRHLKLEGTKAWLLAADPAHEPIALHEVSDAGVWGVVTFVIHRARV